MQTLVFLKQLSYFKKKNSEIYFDWLGIKIAVYIHTNYFKSSSPFLD